MVVALSASKFRSNMVVAAELSVVSFVVILMVSTEASVNVPMFA